MFLGYVDKRPQKWLEIGIGLSRIGHTYANAVPIHLENWLWADVDYDVRLAPDWLRIGLRSTEDWPPEWVQDWLQIGSGLASN